MKPAVWKPVRIAAAADFRSDGVPLRKSEKSMSWGSVSLGFWEGKKRVGLRV